MSPDKLADIIGEASSWTMETFMPQNDLGGPHPDADQVRPIAELLRLFTSELCRRLREIDE